MASQSLPLQQSQGLDSDAPTRRGFSADVNLVALHSFSDVSAEVLDKYCQQSYEIETGLDCLHIASKGNNAVYFSLKVRSTPQFPVIHDPHFTISYSAWNGSLIIAAFLLFGELCK